MNNQLHQNYSTKENAQSSLFQIQNYLFTSSSPLTDLYSSIAVFRNQRKCLPRLHPMACDRHQWLKRHHSDVSSLSVAGR